MPDADFRRKYFAYAKLLRSGRRAQCRCLYPGCQDKAIYSHTVGLRSLRILQSAECKVLRPAEVDPESVIRIGDGSFLTTVPVEEGVRRASAYTLFCNKHDNDCFREFDDGLVTPCGRTAYLAAYRSCCLEYFKKAAFSPAYLNQAAVFGLPESAWEHPTAAKAATAWGGGHSDIKNAKAKLDLGLKRAEFSSLDHLYLAFEGVPFGLASGAVSLEWPFSDGPLARSGAAAGTMFISSRARPYRVDFLFSAFKDDEHGRKTLSGLQGTPDADLTRLLPFLLLHLTEDCFLRQAWFDELSDENKIELVFRMQLFQMDGMSKSPRVWTAKLVERCRLS